MTTPVPAVALTTAAIAGFSSGVVAHEKYSWSSHWGK